MNTATTRPRTEAEAIAAGYTSAIVASSGVFELELMVAPDADLDNTFPAFDRDSLEMIHVNGWLFDIVQAGI